MITQALRFGQSADGGLGDNQAFPYIYNFVKSDDDNNTVTGGVGPLIPALGGVAKLNIVMDSDFNYLPRWIRYTVYYLNPVSGLYEFWETPPATPALFANKLSGMGLPLTAYILVSILFKPDARYAMGQTPSAFSSEIPIPIELLHDPIDSGINGIKVPYMLPAQGRIELTITNNHPTKALTVGGCIFGWKVRI